VNITKKPYVWVEQAIVISALRRCFRRYPPYQAVRTRCKSEWFKKCKNGKLARRVSFRCEECSKLVPNKEFVVDHIDPVVSLETGFVDYNTYAKRLFCSIDNLTGKCKPCHKVKCALEMKTRAAKRKKDKENGK
jgi:hypothetical protein